MSEPRTLNPALTLAEAWRRQLFQQLWDLQVLMARSQMVGAALQVREIHPLATHAVFEASDQGPYSYLAGAAVEQGGLLITDTGEDYGSWEFRDDEAEHWAEFIDKPFDNRWGQTYYLDIEKVLAEVPVPWSPVSGMQHCRHCLEPIRQVNLNLSGHMVWVTYAEAGRNFCPAVEGNPHEPLSAPAASVTINENGD